MLGSFNCAVASAPVRRQEAKPREGDAYRAHETRGPCRRLRRATQSRTVQGVDRAFVRLYRRERHLDGRGDRVILKSRRVVTPSGVRAASVHVRGEKIERVGDYEEKSDIDYGDRVIMPGLVDSHVHVNEPGRTEWEGFESATRAAAAGGVTTIVDMPLNSLPPTT